MTTTMAEHFGEKVKVRFGERGSFRLRDGVLIEGTGTQVQLGSRDYPQYKVEVTIASTTTWTVPEYNILLIDAEGYLYRIDEHLGPWRVTFCCGASVKGVEDGIACRSCYGDVEPGLDGPAVLRG